ncbi:unnamed protein product [Linum trigynum]|uniref:Uncharacterized protein n=1 Tax=Linum trigynum TaxID=586398 RepID=A0AAV2GMR0_9ROSI
MKPESKKNRGKTGASSVADIQNNGVDSCYDFSNLSNALTVMPPPSIVNPTESSTISTTRKDGGSSSLAYDCCIEGQVPKEKGISQNEASFSR